MGAVLWVGSLSKVSPASECFEDIKALNNMPFHRKRPNWHIPTYLVVDDVNKSKRHSALSSTSQPRAPSTTLEKAVPKVLVASRSDL